MKRRLIIQAALLAAVAVGACCALLSVGRTGPLYLYEVAQPQKQAAAQAADSPTVTDKATAALEGQAIPGLSVSDDSVSVTVTSFTPLTGEQKSAVSEAVGATSEGTDYKLEPQGSTIPMPSILFGVALVFAALVFGWMFSYGGLEAALAAAGFAAGLFAGFGAGAAFHAPAAAGYALALVCATCAAVGVTAVSFITRGRFAVASGAHVAEGMDLAYPAVSGDDPEASPVVPGHVTKRTLSRRERDARGDTGAVV